MNLLFSIDDRFVNQLATVLTSIAENTNAEDFQVYVIADHPLEASAQLAAYCEQLKMTYHPVVIDPQDFAQAPITDRYPTTIYYRLLAYKYLPADLDRILYLDADVLCINDLQSFYQMDLSHHLYASAIHTALSNTTDVINKIRLQNFDADGYYNSGVLLMNLELIRQRVKEKDIFNYIEENRLVLLLPDQDVLNALYGDQIKSVPDELYNLDARKGRTYETISFGEWTLDWVMKHTVILHYCGRDKPWLPNKNTGRYTALYKHYYNLTLRRLASLQ